MIVRALHKILVSQNQVINTRQSSPWLSMLPALKEGSGMLLGGMVT